MTAVTCKKRLVRVNPRAYFHFLFPMPYFLFPISSPVSISLFFCLHCFFPSNSSSRVGAVIVTQPSPLQLHHCTIPPVPRRRGVTSFVVVDALQQHPAFQSPRLHSLYSSVNKATPSPRPCIQHLHRTRMPACPCLTCFDLPVLSTASVATTSCSPATDFGSIN
ncbi:hypothetical protein F4823DRAFT_109764 [Ustulina deusta]|nr:hypothetical protein F4823DRAFT_109764 [Ustulina deusta]